MATQGLANYILKDNMRQKGVAIAYDYRTMSVEFVEEAALCLLANGIKAYIFESFRPTRMLYFMLCELACVAGIVVVTAGEVEAALVLATDLVANRLGVYRKNSATREYVQFTVNMTGSLILEYILFKKDELGAFPKNGAVLL